MILGLPGAAGSIFVSRLSTSLHAAAMSANSALRASEPSRKLVMVTLLLITIPVEIIFLAVLNAFGWLNLHVFFVVFSIIFFCCAVCTLLAIELERTPTNFVCVIGPGFTHHRPSPHRLALVQKSRSGYVRPPYTLGVDGSYWPTAACPLFRNCYEAGGEAACPDLIQFLLPSSN